MLKGVTRSRGVERVICPGRGGGFLSFCSNKLKPFFDRREESAPDTNKLRSSLYSSRIITSRMWRWGSIREMREMRENISRTKERR